MKLTVKIIEGKNNFLIGQIKEIPSVLTQGKTVEEVRENLKDALDLYLLDMREESPKESEKLVLEEDFNY